jgi:hypothetical protein
MKALFRHFQRTAAATLLLTLTLGATPRREYLSLYQDQTRHLVIHKQFETALNLRATFLNDAMRERIAEERRRLLNPTSEDHAGFVQRLRDDGAAYHEIVFSADSGLDEDPRFGNSDNGWAIRLEADGVEQTLVTVYRVAKPNPLQRELYPHLNLWSDLWIARFERITRDPQVVNLHFGSGYGNGALRWNTQDTNDRADASRAP